MSACRDCTHFEGGGLAIEAAFPGLSALSSGDASVRGEDGLCMLRDIYLPGSDHCASFHLARAQGWVIGLRLDAVG